MRYKLVGILAAAALLSACAASPEEKGAATGSGGAAQAKPVQAQSQPAARVIEPGSQEDLIANVGDRVFFDFDKYNIDADDRSTLDKQAAWLNANPSVVVSIEGHCDERGTREYNLGLGERRANSVKDYLVSVGINPSRIKVISYGKERPVALGSNDEAWAQNRRGVMVVNGAGS